jgi:hypothetical protein
MKPYRNGARVLKQSALVVQGKDLWTLNQIYRQPPCDQLGWTDLVGLMKSIGNVNEIAADKYVFTVDDERYTAVRPADDLMGAPGLIDVRHFISRAGF